MYMHTFSVDEEKTSVNRLAPVDNVSCYKRDSADTIDPDGK